MLGGGNGKKKTCLQLNKVKPNTIPLQLYNKLEEKHDTQNTLNSVYKKAILRMTITLSEILSQFSRNLMSMALTETNHFCSMVHPRHITEKNYSRPLRGEVRKRRPAKGYRRLELTSISGNKIG